MEKMKKYILLLVLWGVCCFLHAQNRYGRFISYQLTINEGLPSNSITDIVQDDDGFVWLGTLNGLCRYDGYSMLNYHSMSPNQEEVTDSHVAYLTFDPKRKMLKVITTDKAWSYYSTQKGRFVKYDSKWHKTVEPFDRFTTKFGGKLIPNTAGCGIVGDYKYVSDKDGNIYFYPKVGKPFMFHLIENAHVVTYRWNKFRVAIDKEGNLYIASYGEGLYIYHPKTGKMEHLTVKNSNGVLISDFLTAVMVDSTGMIWLGNDDAGVTCISTTVPEMDEYLYLEPQNRFGWNNNVRCVAQRKDGSAFVGSSMGIGYSWNPAQSQFVRESVFPSSIFCYVEARDGSTWIGTRGAGFYVDGVNYSTKDKKHHSPSDLIYDMVEDAKGRMWIATYEGGLLLAEKSKDGSLKISQFLTASLDESRIYCLCMGKDEVLWISSKNGIYRVDAKQNQFTHSSFTNFCRKNSDLPGNEIPAFYQALDGTFWAGISGQGLVHFKYENGKLKVLAQLNTSSGISMNAVYSIVEDLYGNVWVGTEQGLVQIDIQQLTVRTYNLAPTFMGNVFTERCAVLLKDGSLAFGTKDGLLVMRGIKGWNLRQSHDRIVFSDLLVNGTSIYNTANIEGLENISLTKASEVELQHGQNSITICYSDLNFSPSSMSLFQYYLEGHDKTWRAATTQKQANYDNLPPGQYVFHVRQASGADGNNKEYTLRIVICQPWYNTWWAWICYLLVVSLVGSYVYHLLNERAKLNRKIKIEEEMMEFKLSFFTHITHEFRTPLAIIQTAVDKMKNPQSMTFSRSALATAQRGVKRLLRLVNQLMEFRKMNAGAMNLHVDKGDIIQFVRQIYQDVWQVGNQKNIHMTFVPFAQHYDMYFDDRAVEMVVYNLLSNALKYTPAGGSVTLKVLQNDEFLLISVEDTGKGITPEQQKHLFQPFMQGEMSQGGMGIGLYMAHSMAELHHGDLVYQRQENGSVFVVKLPVSDEAYTDKEKENSLAIQTFAEEDSIDEVVMENLPESINNCKIAIVEDDFDMMGQMKEELAKYFKLETYMDGETAVNELGEDVALLLCDVMLPGISGYDVVKRIKQKHPYLPVIMLTALNDERHQIKGYQVGVDDYMLKPCNFKVLVARMVQLIEWNLQAREKERLMKEKLDAKPSSDASTEQPAGENAQKVQLLTSLQDKRFLAKLDNMVASHMMDGNYSIDDLATALHMGRSKFYGKVKELTGLSPNKYFLRYRMKEAAKLLEKDEMTISEIAYQVGIQEPSYFYRCFKSYFGVSPSEYKKNGGTMLPSSDENK